MPPLIALETGYPSSAAAIVATSSWNHDSSAATAAAQSHFDLPADRASVALPRFAQQAGVEVIFSSEATAGIRTNAVVGDFTPQEAIARLLSNTGLLAERSSQTGAFVVMKVPATEVPLPKPKTDGTARDSRHAAAQPTQEPTGVKSRNPLVLLLGWVALALNPGVAAAGAVAESGSITGRVFNPANREYVRNVEIRVQGTSTVVFSSEDGSYRLANLPAGEARITATYTGYRTNVATVGVVGGQTVNHDFELHPSLSQSDREVIELGRFIVSTGIEGDAKALMEQRAAMNIKNVVASDSFGDLSEGNVGELLQYLPGVQIEYSESDIVGASMGGLGPQYGALMIDGVRVTSSSGAGRNPGFIAINARSAETIELNKTISADMDADAPAGTINLTSKNAFQRRGRHINWQVYATANSDKLTLGRRGGPSDLKHHQIHPNGSIEVIDTFLSGRLGMAVSFDWTHTIHETNYVNNAYNTTPTAINPDPIVVTQITYRDGTKANRNQRGSLSFDYKLSERIVLSWRSQIRRGDTRFYDRDFILVTARNNIAPGSNASFQIANSAGTGTRLQMGGTYNERDDNFVSYSPQVAYSGDQWDIDAAFSYSQIEIRHRNGRPDGSGEGPPSAHTISLSPVSWRLERSGPDQTAWHYQQISGEDFYDITNWNFSFPANSVARNGGLNQPTRKKYHGHINAKFAPNWTLPTSFKTGLKVQEEIYDILLGNHTWTYVGPQEAALVLSDYHFDPKMGGNLFDRRIPFLQRNVLGELMQTHPEYFVPNPAGPANAANVSPRRYAKEQINAAYLMGNTQWDRLTFQGGFRVEETLTAAKIYERGVLRTRHGEYRNVFWSGAAKYRLMDDLIATASYNQSIMRPSFNNMTGVMTINDTTLVGNIPNPNLRPEYGENYSARVEYYLPSAGIVSAGFFRRDIRDRHFQRSEIPAEELGLGQDYPGYMFTSWDNADSFTTRGYELEYRQQLSRLPGVFKGLGVFANYTRVKNDQPEFAFGSAPRMGSAGFSYRYRRFSGSLRGSWTDEVVTSVTVYRKARTIIGLSARYQLPRNMALFINGRNIFKEPTVTYDRRFSNHLIRFWEFGSIWTMGVEGKF